MSEKSILDLDNIKISLHTDADGIYSGVLLSTVIRVREVVFPDIFGEYSDEDLILDQVPVDPLYDKLVIDHHPQHPENRRYRLIYDTVPTTLIVYNILKDHIPRDRSWLVVGGLVGDGQPELIPSNIWREHPCLLDEIGYMSDYRGDLHFYRTPLWNLLSSPVNALCRCNQPDTAFNIVKNARDPYDIINDPTCRVAKRRVDEEIKKILKDQQPVDLGYVIYWEIDTDLKLCGLLASRSEAMYKKTTIVVNRKNGHISVRGVLSDLIREELSKKNYNIGGHLGYMGGILSSDQDTRKLLEDLRKIRL